jgi:hypothetical protein
MKAEADIDFVSGENLLIFHGSPYSPPQVAEPGWSLYASAVFNDHNPWHPVMANTSNHKVMTRASFGTAHNYGEQWDPICWRVGTALRSTSTTRPSMPGPRSRPTTTSR